ncbi:hypothetical protein BaRGS_00037684 [Batillaria attramentaria]|uniref:Opioid growth factor receptor (OGFr) conserved domain-containing protein n=1 Tax=Batillaria attramentaria TaxID=370345 RepID=A0ABD0J894_9CAEN
MNAAAEVTCYFGEDISQSYKPFKMYRYRSDSRRSSRENEEIVLDCFWVEREKLNCQTAPGYEFDYNVSDNLTVSIVKTTPEFVAWYECRVEPSYPNDIEDCFLNYKVSAEPEETTSTSDEFSEEFSAQKPAEEASDEEGNTKIYIAAACIGGLLLVVAILCWRFKVHNRIKERFWGQQEPRGSQWDEELPLQNKENPPGPSGAGQDSSGPEQDTPLLDEGAAESEQDRTHPNSVKLKLENETEPSNRRSTNVDMDTQGEENSTGQKGASNLSDDLEESNSVHDEGCQTMPSLADQPPWPGATPAEPWKPYSDGRPPDTAEAGDQSHGDEEEEESMRDWDTCNDVDKRPVLTRQDSFDFTHGKEVNGARGEDLGACKVETTGEAPSTHDSDAASTETTAASSGTLDEWLDSKDDKGRKYREHYPGKEDDPMLTENLLFYQNKIKCRPKGEFIDDIHRKWWNDFNRLEHHHGYTQWLFPIREPGMNRNAQELQLHEAEAIKKDKEAHARFVKSYEMMLNFYGLRLVNNTTGEVERAAHWEKGFRHLHENYSHNYLRVTRILKCLGEMGLEHYKAPLIRRLIHEAIVEETLAFKGLLDSCRRFWITTLRDNKERATVMQLFRTLLENRGPDWKPLQNSSGCPIS